MKKKIASLFACAVMIFSVFVSSASAEVSEDSKKELLRYILYTARQESKEEIDTAELFLDTLMKYAGGDDEKYNEILRLFTESIDEYGEYYSPDEVEELNADLTSVSGGIGATVEMRNGAFNIVNVLPGSSAEEAGVEAGWQILGVDGKTAENISLYKALSYVRGEIGTAVTIKFLTNAHQELTLTLTRCKIDIETVSHQMLTDTKNPIGYISINNFATTTGKELTTAINDLKNQGADRLILDLRDNGGGVLEGALEVASCFLDKGKTILTIEPRDTSKKEVYTSTGKIFDGDLLVLVNEYSASASEVVTGALKDNGRAEIMGIKTYGKGTVQTLYNLPLYGGVFKFTTAHYLTPNGTDINKVGIEPDIKVPNSEYQLMDQEVAQLSLTRKFNIGDEGEDIGVIKDFLSKMRYKVSEGNVYDEQTFYSVKQFQKNHDLYAYGICDFTTQKAIRQALLDATFYTDNQTEAAIKHMDSK